MSSPSEIRDLAIGRIKALEARMKENKFSHERYITDERECEVLNDWLIADWNGKLAKKGE